MPDSINIRPGVSILSVLRHLNYKPWFAIAEFVDNALQSYLDYRKRLERVDGKGYKLRVSIELSPHDGGRITIRDNAAGIHEKDYARAFRPAEIPPDRHGLSEFGMGMKSAATWFARNWTVRTSGLAEEVERTVSFDIDEIVRNGREELSVETRLAPANAHYTEIVLTNLHNLPQKRTIGKIKDHLASMYRVFIREGLLVLRFDHDQLTYEEPRILSAPFYKNPTAGPVYWHKELELDLSGGLRAHGFAALRETASTSEAGFALFRRQRLIQGSADEGYRPEYIFRKPNSYTYQRLFGELHLEGFEVSHTKDGFRWEEHEETFLQHLKEQLNAMPLPLLSQAEEYRVNPKQGELKDVADSAVERTAEVIEHEVPPVLEQIKNAPVRQDPPEALPEATTASQRVINVNLKGAQWQILLELSNDPAVGDWVEISDFPIDGAVRRVGVRMALVHPFTVRFAGADGAGIEPLLRLAAAIGLSETAARDSGVRKAGTFRRNINELLKDALSKP